MDMNERAYNARINISACIALGLDVEEECEKVESGLLSKAYDIRISECVSYEEARAHRQP